MPEQECSATLRDLPPSAKLVYTVLKYEGELTQQELIEEAYIAPTTVRDALTRLEEIDVIDEEVHILDARQRLYRVTDGSQSK